ncbi:selenide, water dikinase [Klebsormidium nitens]|uniref:Selenide, water dikinase n=1 Tax=Klebsormidium nitens TaxID=105231 RepID=A0A1Y1HV03_KLENI|nr:selenide, water dikinase [Klebsormidium nitens]|eukprot:GAQ81019.1 selenide, water dikinase [Klebsormidium nitens]
MQDAGTAAGVVVKDLVLLGGGHSHVHVLKSFAMQPLPGVRLTLITRDVHTPYSGMLPGYVAGHYEYDDCHVDLRPLARLAAARLLHCTATSLDRDSRLVHLQGRPPIPYDVLSIDIGITPLQDVPGSSEHTTAVKPIDSFTARWADLAERVVASAEALCVAVVGGGAGGVELCLAMQHALQQRLRQAGKDPGRVTFRLHTRGRLLAQHPPRVGRIFARILKERGVAVVDGGVAAVRAGELELVGGAVLPFSECIWCTQGGAQPWLHKTGLALDAAGFIDVDATLRSTNDPAVFAAGDIHSSKQYPRPKAGVYAVRQGPPLAANLRRSLLGQPLRPFVPQSTALAIISTGNKYAVASKGGFALEGAWLWPIKDWIDRRWMALYSHLPPMALPAPSPSEVASAAGPAAVAAVGAARMRCGGCGAKVGAPVLQRVLARLDAPTRPEVVVGLGDDAAVVRLPPGTVGVHTVDVLRALVDDEYTFGAIAANHALGDCYAMGAQPLSALAIATLPYGLDSKVEADLFQLMAGAASVLRTAECALVGGHTSEGADLALGFAVHGAVAEAAVLRKGGLQPGDRLLLTKAVGTGALFAADMRGQCAGRDVDTAVASMLQSSREAAAALRSAGATAVTDVTGFGLLGHLEEMVRASGVDVAVSLPAVPVLPGAAAAVAAGYVSSLHASNQYAAGAVSNREEAAQHPLFPLLTDPQTAGGLLAGVPAAAASECLQALHRAGYTEAAEIGRVVEGSGSPIPIVVELTLVPAKNTPTSDNEGGGPSQAVAGP